MTELDERLRELFDRKAADVPPHGSVPPSLRPRARRRIALNAIVAVVVVAAVGGGAVGALGAIERADSGESMSRPTTATPATSPAACSAGQLRAVARIEGAMGSRAGEIVLTNDSDTRCTLEGRPTITLLTPTRRPISGIEFDDAQPAWQANREPAPAGWPVVTMRPGQAASVRLSWSNWCSGTTPLWQIGVPGGGTAEVIGMDAAGTPPCNGEALPPAVEVGPFEPPR